MDGIRYSTTLYHKIFWRIENYTQDKEKLYMSIQKQTEFVSVGLKSRMDGEPSKFTALTLQNLTNQNLIITL